MRHNPAFLNRACIMKYDKLRGSNLAGLISELRERFGKDVYVLNTRELKEGGVLGTGLFSKKIYEVEYMVREDHAPFQKKSQPVRSAGVLDFDSKPYTGSEIRHSPARMIGTTSVPVMEKNVEVEEDLHRFERDLSPEGPVVSMQQDSQDSFEPVAKYDEDSFAELDRLIQNLKQASNRSRKKNNSQGGSVSRTAKKMEEAREAKVEKAIAVMNSLTSAEEPVEEKTDFSKSGFESKPYFPIIEHPTQDELEALWSDEVEMQSRIRIENHTEELPAPFHKIKSQLKRCRFSDEFVKDFLDHLQDSTSKHDQKKPAIVRKKAEHLLSSRIQIDSRLAPPAGELKAIFVVGPPGCGKTTSLAKMAAKLSYRGEAEGPKDVSIFSLDKYRLGAAEQLKKFAEILDASYHYHGVSQPIQFAGALASETNTDVILVDTSGISAHEKKRLKELEDFIEACPDDLPVEIHLTLAANSDRESIRRTCDAFHSLSRGFDKIILTKLDETDFFGPMIESADKFHRPFSFFTNGQRVPDDILEMQPDAFAQMVLDA